MGVEKHSTMNAFILAGGKSSRIRSDKAFLKYSGKYFIDIIIDCTSHLFDRVYLVGKDYKNPLLAGRYRDEVQGIGPLGGIYTALRRTDKQINFFIGTDYPFIDPETITYLANVMKEKSPPYHGLIPVLPDGPHPLCAFYSKACLPSVMRCISEGRYRVLCIADHCPVWYHDMAHDGLLLPLERLKRSFTNINNIEDLQKYIGE